MKKLYGETLKFILR